MRRPRYPPKPIITNDRRNKATYITRLPASGPRETASPQHVVLTIQRAALPLQCIHHILRGIQVTQNEEEKRDTGHLVTIAVTVFRRACSTQQSGQ